METLDGANGVYLVMFKVYIKKLAMELGSAYIHKPASSVAMHFISRDSYLNRCPDLFNFAHLASLPCSELCQFLK